MLAIFQKFQQAFPLLRRGQAAPPQENQETVTEAWRCVVMTILHGDKKHFNYEGLVAARIAEAQKKSRIETKGEVLGVVIRFMPEPSKERDRVYCDLARGVNLGPSA